MEKEIVIIDSAKIKWKGHFDFKVLYNKLKDWLVNEGYGEPKEKLYAEKIKPTGSKNMEIVWTASKIEEDYFGLLIKIQFFGINIEDVEVTNDEGKKLKLNNGEIEIKFTSVLTLDINSRFGKGPNISIQQKFYEKYIILDNIEKQKIELYEKTMDIIDLTKNYLNLYRL
jgi:hypothetical protein